MDELRFWKKACAVFLLCAAAAITSSAQTFTTLANFNGTNGDGPFYMSLVQGADGNFYGTTSEGGAIGYGAVFKISSQGALMTVYSFDSDDGAYPYAGVLLATDGNLYGTTYLGGTHYTNGTIFKLTPQGTRTTLYNFDWTNGANPSAALIQGANGYIYGTTTLGGAVSPGTVFGLTPGGAVATLHSFGITDGAEPNGGWFRVPTGTSTGQPSTVGPTTMVRSLV